MIALRLVVALCLLGLAILAAPTAAPGAVPAAAPEWREWPLPVPAGGSFQTRAGFPGDLSFFAPNRGLMTVAGNNSVQEGLWSWDGVQWHQLATVCGGGASARIAWAGPDEFWTIARPSSPRDKDQGGGFALCHFKGGRVVGSYSSVLGAEDQYSSMSAAACNGPSDCWFGGDAGFHLRWDGSSVQIVRGPQGRGVSDLLADGARFFESTLVGANSLADASSVVLRDAEETPRLLHRITGGAFSNDPFVPGTFSSNTELRALDSDGTTRWAVGGGATFGPSFTERQPLAARLTVDTWSELALTGEPLPTDKTFGDVAAIPGSGGAAWATLIDPSPIVGGDTSAAEAQAPEIARIAADGAVRIVKLASVVDGKGAAVRVDCPAPDDCWVATARGFLFRLTGAPATPADTDPAFQGTITVRPNEAAEQAVSDDPPVDDSLLLAPPVEAAPEPQEADEDAETCTPPRLISRQRSKVIGKKRLRLVISFRLARRARIGVTARRGGKVVARAKLRTLPRGNRSLTLNVTRKRYPKQLSFVIRNDSAAAACAAAAARGTTSP